MCTVLHAHSFEFAHVCRIKNMEANHAEVVIGVHKTGQQNTKAPATLEESAAFRPPDQHTEHNTWHDQAEGNSSRCSKLDLSWMLFILGWVIAPCWWVGVAMGLTTGADNKFLIVRKQGLKPTQVKAWWANLSMTTSAPCWLFWSVPST